MSSVSAQDRGEFRGGAARDAATRRGPGPTRTASRIGAVGAVGGGLLMLVGNLLHPREPGQLEDADTFLAVAAGSDLWVVDHLLILVAVSLLVGAFYGLARSFLTEPGVTWARLAWGVSIIGVTFALALMITEATAVATVAESWAAGSGAERDVALAAGFTLLELSLAVSVGAMVFFFGATPVLFGVALLTSDDHPSWVGWAGVIFGSVAVVAGSLQLLTGQAALTQLVLFPVAAIGFILWIISVGVLLGRRPAVGT